MNPRMLDVVAMWRMESKKDAEDKEDEAQSLFTSYTVCRGTEWYWASPDDAVEKISKVLGVPDYKLGGTMPFKVSAIYSGNAHDELREKGDIYTPRGAETGYRVQQRIWVHEEVGGPYRKVSHNTWWRGIKGKTSNDKCLTFNTLDVQPVACYAFELDLSASDLDWQMQKANERTITIWHEAVERFRISTPPGRLCWTEAPLQELLPFLEYKGLVALDMSAPKAPTAIKSRAVA